MARLRRNLARQTNDFEEFDKEMAFGIFYLEREVNIGLIGEDFPLLKFWNQWDEENLEKYKKIQERNADPRGKAKTFR